MNFKEYTIKGSVQRLTRGLANMSPYDGWPPEVAQRLLNGTATVSDIGLALDNFKHLGHNWWREGEEGNTHEDNVEDSMEYAYTESSDLLKQALADHDPRHGPEINGSIAIVLVAEVSKKVRENEWSGEIPDSTKLTVTEIRYDAGNGWNLLKTNINARP